MSKIIFRTLNGYEGFVTIEDDGTLTPSDEIQAAALAEWFEGGGDEESFINKYSEYFSGYESSYLEDAEDLEQDSDE
jgi:hypothetical protein